MFDVSVEFVQIFDINSFHAPDTSGHVASTVISDVICWVSVNTA